MNEKWACEKSQALIKVLNLYCQKSLYKENLNEST